MLCYESNTEFCHRHIVAAWFEILLGKKTLEIKEKDYQIEEVERPEYIKQYLEEIMRSNNMHGFKSLRALYLFEKGEKLEVKASELKKMGKYYDNYRQNACYLRCYADMVENEYQTHEKEKRLVKSKIYFC